MHARSSPFVWISLSPFLYALLSFFLLIFSPLFVIDGRTMINESNIHVMLKFLKLEIHRSRLNRSPY